MKVTDQMVSRFLSWKLPDDFNPGNGVSYNWAQADTFGPTGTSLFSAEQARQMLEHVLGPESERCAAQLAPTENARERAARQAMQGILASMGANSSFAAIQTLAAQRGVSFEATVAGMAVENADALLAELAKGKS